MTFILIFLTFAGLSLIYWLCGKTRRSVLLEKIPGPPSLPVVGHLFYAMVSVADVWSVLQNFAQTYSPTFHLWMFRYSIINLQHPDDAKTLLTSPKHINKSKVYDFLHAWLKTGLLTSTENKWRKRRKMVMPAFHRDIMREFACIFDKQSRIMVQELKDTEGNDECDVVPLVTKYILNTICETAMGKSRDLTTTFHVKYRNAIREMGQVFYHRILRPWLYLDFFFYLSPTGRKEKKALEVIHGLTSKLIRERMRYHENTNGIYLNNDHPSPIDSKSKKRYAMLDLLIMAMKGGEIDEEGIKEEVDTVLLGGHDTTAMSICFTLLLLAEHKDVQQRARKEVDSVLDRSQGKMDIDDIQQFTYLERCLKESLRLYPSVPIVSREIKEELRLKNYVLPAETISFVNIYNLHRNPSFWPNPHTFDPDRFLPERSVGRHPFAYIPFSGGQRECIGKKFAMFELKVFVSQLLHNFYIEPIDLASEIKIQADLILRPVHPMRVRFVPR